MTPEQLAADRAVCDAATDAPWAYRLDTPAGVHQPRFQCWIPQTREDAIFIAAARTRWPEALDEIERLNELLQIADREVGQLRKEKHALQAQVAGHAERIAKQSELLSRKSEKAST